MTRLTVLGKTFVKRFPYIVGYTFLALVLFASLREGYRWVAPGSWYLGYDSYQIESVPEDENIPYTACRSNYGNYEIRGGSRTVFKIVDVKHPDKETLFDTVPFPAGTNTTNRRCVSSFIDIIKGKDVLDLPVGSYRVTHVVKFKIDSILPWVKDGYDKRSETRSNIFTISARVLTPEDLRKRIEDLEKELDDLKKQLSTVETKSSSTTTPSTPSSTTTVNNNVSPQNQTPPSTPVAPSDTRSPLGKLPVVGGLFDDLGL